MDPAHAVAIETALGNAVQHIVCDTQSDAKAAIRYLKHGSLGRATFQPIDAVKAKPLTETGLDDAVGFVGLAHALVQCESQYREVIAALLGRTVVAEDLDCAVSIARQYGYRFKIVTLDGQVVNPGGSMTGGSQSKTAGFLTRNSEIERLREKSEALQKKTDAIRESHTAALNAAQQTADELTAAKDTALTLSQEQIRLAGEQRLFDEQVASAADALDTLQNELSSFDTRLKQLQSDADNAQATTGAIDVKTSSTVCTNSGWYE